MSDPDDAAVRLYLLGLMPEADAEALEAEYFARPELFDRVRAAEDDLLDDYAAGRLGGADTGALEARYLASGPLRQRVVAARALRLAGARPGRVVPFRGVARRAAPLAIAAGLVIALLTSWLWQLRQSVTPGPAPSVARDERPTPGPSDSGSPGPAPRANPSPSVKPSARPTSAAPAMSRLVFALSPTLLRGEGGPAQVGILPGTGVVVLELQGDPTTVPRSGLGASIETVEGTRVWSGPAARKGGPLLVASVAVPADHLAPGDYLVTLSAGDQTLYRYFFRVPSR